jgi:protein phosphatase
MPLRMAAACAVRSDVGRKRDFNEDFFGVDPASGVFAVADGLGGHVAGRRASETAVHSFLAACATAADAGDENPLAFLRRAFRQANQAIRALAASDPALRGMGTTLAALYVRGAEAAIAHVGDSRVYLLRGEKLHALTLDHSMVADLVAFRRLAPAAAQRHPQRHVITRALGVSPGLEPDAGMLRLRPDDAFVLCTDGICAALSEDEIARVLALAGPDLDAAADDLISLANERGGEDNATVVIVRP